MSSLRDRIHAAAARFADELVAAIETHTGASEWVDQDQSPLGRRRHLDAVRRGDLPASKDGRRVLVRRADVEAYILKKAVMVTPSDEADVDTILRDIEQGMREQ